jgi:hypothetical protein
MLPTIGLVERGPGAATRALGTVWRRKGKLMKTISCPLHGCNLREALRYAKKIGCVVESRNGTGEVFVYHPKYLVFGKRRPDARRKDSTRHLTAFLRKLTDALKGKQVI